MKYLFLLATLLLVACNPFNIKPPEDTKEEKFFNVTIDGKIYGVETCGIDVSNRVLVFETKAEPDTVFIESDGHFYGHVTQLKSKIHYEACCLVYVYVSPDCPHKSMASLIDLEMDTLINNIEFCVSESQDMELFYIDKSPVQLELINRDVDSIDFHEVQFNADFINEAMILKKDAPYYFDLLPGEYDYRYRERFTDHSTWVHKTINIEQCTDPILEIPY